MKKHKQIFIFYIVLCTILTYFSYDIYLPAMPYMKEAFGVSIPALQTTLSFYFLGAAITQIFVGPILDHFGYRHIAIWAGILFVISSLLCALSESLLSLVGFRFLQAIAAGSITLVGRESA